MWRTSRIDATFFSLRAAKSPKKLEVENTISEGTYCSFIQSSHTTTSYELHELYVPDPLTRYPDHEPSVKLDNILSTRFLVEKVGIG